MPKYLLVSFKTCPWVQRSAIVLREKGVPFEFRHIEPDNRPDWFLAISPHKKVPVLRVDDTVSLFESNAINEYLDETIAPRLHPDDPVQRAVNRAWTDYVPTFSEHVTGVAYADDEAHALLRAQPEGAPFSMRAAVRDAVSGLDLRNIAGEARPAVVTGALPTTFIGSPDTVVEQVRRCREVVGAGVLDLSLHPPGSPDLDSLTRALELFGAKVLPRIREI